MRTTLSTDLRIAARVLRKSPLFTVVAAFCIALGSGAATTIFSALNALVLRMLQTHGMLFVELSGQESYLIGVYRQALHRLTSRAVDTRQTRLP